MAVHGLCGRIKCHAVETETRSRSVNRDGTDIGRRARRCLIKVISEVKGTWSAMSTAGCCVENRERGMDLQKKAESCCVLSEDKIRSLGVRHYRHGYPISVF